MILNIIYDGCSQDSTRCSPRVDHTPMSYKDVPLSPFDMGGLGS